MTPADARQWRPIETAPKDGTRLRLGHEKELGFGKKDPHGMGAVSGDWNGTRSARRAGYTGNVNTITSMASKLLSNEEIAQAVGTVIGED